jgi:hypothetical protein
MMKGFFSAVVIAAFAGTSLVQAMLPAGPAPADSLVSGTVLSVELSKSLDARRSKVNDRIEAKTLADVLVNGQVVVPRNTKIIGHVTESKARSKTSPDSTLGIVFDRMLLKSGEVLLPMTIMSVAQPVHISSDVGREPDSLADRTTIPGRLPSVGSPAPPTGSSSLPPDYPNPIPAPPSINVSGPSKSTTPLGSASRGVMGTKGLSLDTSGPAPILSSKTANVHLDGGAQFLLRVQ